MRPRAERIVVGLRFAEYARHGIGDMHLDFGQLPQFLVQISHCFFFLTSLPDQRRGEELQLGISAGGGPLHAVGVQVIDMSQFVNVLQSVHRGVLNGHRKGR